MSGSRRSANGPSPRCSIADWVRLPASLWVLEITMSAPRRSALTGSCRVEAEVRAPRLVDDQRHAMGVGHVGQRANVGDGSEVARGHDVRGCRVRVLDEAVLELVGGDAVGDPEVGVDRREGEERVESGQGEAVDHRGVHAALHDHLGAEPAQGEVGDQVALARAVRQEPRLAGAPRLRREARRAHERRGVVAVVDPVGQRRYVERQRPVPEEVDEAGLGDAGGLVARHVEADPVLVGVARDGVGVRRRGLWVGRDAWSRSSPDECGSGLATEIKLGSNEI